MVKISAILVFCILIVSALQAQSREQIDSITLNRDFNNALVREECVKAHIQGDSLIVPDSLTAQVFVSKCDGYQGAVAFVRDTAVTPANLYYLNDVILRDRSDFLLMCSMTRAVGPVYCSSRTKTVP